MKQQTLNLCAILCLIASGAFAAPPAITAKETYNCMSLYWPWTDDLATATASSVCTVEYRTPAGAGSWLPGLDLWADDANNTFSGSVVYLAAGAEYEFRLTCDSPAVTTTVTASTRSDVFGEGTVTAFGNKTSTFAIAAVDSGSAGSYHVYENGTMITANPGADYQVTIAANTHHVILRNITFTGGHKNCIQIGDDCTDIVIENCTFSGWGQPGIADSSVFPDSRDNAAIASSTSTSDLIRITVQNCTFISDTSGSCDWGDLLPRTEDGLGSAGELDFSAVTDEGGGKIGFVVAGLFNAADLLGTDDYAPKKFGVEGGTAYDQAHTMANYDNLYVVDVALTTANKIVTTGTFGATASGNLQFDTTSHPLGSHAVFFEDSIGQHVIRFNRAYATSANRMFNDVLGGGQNSSLTKGAFGNDSDIHGNDLGWALDDGIECEGSNTNNRIWNNYLHHNQVALATASIKDGPVYTFRNVVAECRAERENATTSAGAWKVGNTSLGRQYWFFNTIDQQGTTNGHAEGYNQSGGVSVQYMYARNNIIDVEGRIAYDLAEASTHSLQFDLIDKVPAYDALHTNNYGGATNPPNGVSPPSGGEGYFLGTATFTADGPFPDCLTNSITSLSLGYRGGEAVKNFGMNASDRSTITDPDVGAMDARMMPFVYGIQGVPGDFIISGTLTIGP